MSLISQEPSTTPRDLQVRGYLEQLDAILLEARQVAAELSPEQFNWRPEGKRWSVGQCLEHLTLTARLYPAKIEAMIAESAQRSGRGEPAYREGWFTNWFVRSMEPPPSMRVRTSSKVEPASSLDPAAVLAAFEESHRELGRLIRSADGVSLTHGRTASPFLSLLRFTMNQVFGTLMAHARRHLWQARQVVGHPAFPARGN
jgi:hypothetical protein